MSEYIKKEDAINLTWREPTYTDPLNVLTEVRDGLNELPTYSFPDREKGEWIPVSERLPEDRGDYIIDYTNEFGEFVGISHYDKYGFWSSSNVIAWQPLPEPYKEGGNE